MSEFIQYELWKDCNNKCKFCFNKNQKDVNKIESLNFVINNLLDKETDNYNEIGFIGGEFFDGQLKNEEVKTLFYKLFEICKEKSDLNKLDKLYFTTSLIFDISKNTDLIQFLDYLKELKLLNKSLLCTSFDLKYRFHNSKLLNYWTENMKFIHEQYPELKLHTEIIVTQFFIDAVLNNTFSITEFKRMYNTSLDYIEPASGFYYLDKESMSKDLPDFFPTKSSFIKFLKKVGIDSDEIELYKFLSMNTRSSTMYYTIDGKRFVIKNRRTNKENKFESSSTKAKYEIGLIDSDTKMIDIVNKLLRMRG